MIRVLDEIINLHWSSSFRVLHIPKQAEPFCSILSKSNTVKQIVVQFCFANNKKDFL